MTQLIHCHSLSLASVKSRLDLVPAHSGNLGQSPDGRKMDVCIWLILSCLSECSVNVSSWFFV